VKTKAGREIENLMNKNPNNWKGIFYFNKRDYRIFVPKSNPSLGWTLNFASPYTYLFFIAMAAIILISEYLL
jgi:uncharacterized membrane protein